MELGARLRLGGRGPPDPVHVQVVHPDDEGVPYADPATPDASVVSRQNRLRELDGDLRCPVDPVPASLDEVEASQQSGFLLRHPSHQVQVRLVVFGCGVEVLGRPAHDHRGVEQNLRQRSGNQEVTAEPVRLARRFSEKVACVRNTHGSGHRQSGSQPLRLMERGPTG